MNNESLLSVLNGRASEEIVVNTFDEESAQLFRDKVLDASKDDPMRPIVIYIDSDGGEIDSLAKMIETLDEIPNPIVTVAMGKAMSAGAILLSCGDIRFCGPHSRVMVHEVLSGAAGNVHDLDVAVSEGKRLNRHFLNMLAVNCGIKGGYDALRKIIKSQDGRDNYMDANEAKKFGVVDFVGLPSIKRAVVYQIDMVPPKARLMKVKTHQRDKKSDTR